MDPRMTPGADSVIAQLTETIAELTAAKLAQNAENTALANELVVALQIRNEARRQSNLDLEKSREMAYLQYRVKKWVKERIGEKAMAPAERAMRILEESLELAQAHGIKMGMVLRQAEHVYGREPGDARQEAGGVAVCLLGWCAAAGVQLVDLARAEVERIEAKPIEEIRGSLARKKDADLFVSALPAEGDL